MVDVKFGSASSTALENILVLPRLARFSLGGNLCQKKK